MHLFLDEDIEILLINEFDANGLVRRPLLEYAAIVTASQHQISLAHLLQVLVSLLVRDVSLQKDAP